MPIQRLRKGRSGKGKSRLLRGSSGREVYPRMPVSILDSARGGRPGSPRGDALGGLSHLVSWSLELCKVPGLQEAAPMGWGPPAGPGGAALPSGTAARPATGKARATRVHAGLEGAQPPPPPPRRHMGRPRRRAAPSSPRLAASRSSGHSTSHVFQRSLRAQRPGHQD